MTLRQGHAHTIWRNIEKHDRKLFAQSEHRLHGANVMLPHRMRRQDDIAEQNCALKCKTDTEVV